MRDKFEGTEGCVAVLLATLNGSAYISQQLASIEAQTYPNWFLIASDDGSTDNTRDVLGRFAQECEQAVVIRDGPRQGACANFLSMAVDSSIEADFYAFSDQDDIWHADKLSRAVAWLKSAPSDVAALYCGRTELIDQNGRSFGLSPLFTRAPDFRNALVQSIGGGNTMVFNRAAKRLVESVGMVDAVSHDWWMYQLVSLVGGLVYYDPVPAIDYRQHSDNLIGSNLGWKARLTRVEMTLDGRFGRWNDRNLAALACVPDELISPKYKTVVEQFAAARSGPIARRLLYLWRSGVYRQTLLGNVGLVAVTLLGKL